MAETAQGPALVNRLASFRVTYLAIVAFVLLSVVSIIGAETLLEAYFQSAVARAIHADPARGSIAEQIQNQVADLIQLSPWTQIGGVRVDAIVIGADNTSLYALGRTPLPPPFTDPFIEAQRILPATADVFVSVPLDALLPSGIIVSYGAILIWGLFLYTRRVARRDQQEIDAAIEVRDRSARRAETIERELSQVRTRLAEVEPSERANAEEIRELQVERAALQNKLGDLAEREALLRASAERSTELDQERQALEDLLEEAVEDLGQRETEIESLQARLKRAEGSAPAPSKRSRGVEKIARRMRTLYKNVSIADTALQDLQNLRDDAMKLRAEEGIKRLDDNPDTAVIRRKVGGLPPHLSIFELGFAGKGRIYYTRGEGQRYCVLKVGAKNSQKTDLEFLSRL